MPLGWHPDKWWDWCMSEDEKKEIDPSFIQDLQKCLSLVYKLGVLKQLRLEVLSHILSNIKCLC